MTFNEVVTVRKACKGSQLAVVPVEKAPNEKKNSMYFVLFSRVEGSRNLSYPREGCVTINKMKLELCRKKSIATANYYYKNSF